MHISILYYTCPLAWPRGRLAAWPPGLLAAWPPGRLAACLEGGGAAAADDCTQACLLSREQPTSASTVLLAEPGEPGGASQAAASHAADRAAVAHSPRPHPHGRFPDGAKEIDRFRKYPNRYTQKSIRIVLRRASGVWWARLKTLALIIRRVSSRHLYTALRGRAVYEMLESQLRDSSLGNRRRL